LDGVAAAGGPLRVAVLASGNGSNLQAILDTLHGRGTVEVVGVASDKPGARALERAEEAGVETATFPRGEYSDREARDAAMGEWLESRGVQLVVLAGYMQLLSGSFIGRFRNRIVNVHPALLPSFPGLDAVEQAIAHGVRLTGVTVHFVDEGVDTGPILLQEAVELTYTRPVAEVLEQIHAVEHRLLPEAIELIASGSVRIDDQNPRLVRIER
jgi:phosphoribosylglycinamide formyltransferase-1